MPENITARKRGNPSQVVTVFLVLMAVPPLAVGTYLFLPSVAFSSPSEVVATVNDGDEEEPRPSTIPRDVEYQVIPHDIIPGIKRSVDVRINRRVDKQTLRAIALEIKRSDKGTYQRTFIAYFLPHMRIGAGAWATTHFNPSLEIKIFGLAPDDKWLKDQPSAESGSSKVLGTWVVEAAFAYRITITEQSGNYIWEQSFKDGSGSKKELVETPNSSGRRFEDKAGPRFGEYYVIGTDGNLHLYDKDGLISVAKKIP